MAVAFWCCYFRFFILGCLCFFREMAVVQVNACFLLSQRKCRQRSTQEIATDRVLHARRPWIIRRGNRKQNLFILTKEDKEDCFFCDSYCSPCFHCYGLASLWSISSTCYTIIYSFSFFFPIGSMVNPIIYWLIILLPSFVQV